MHQELHLASCRSEGDPKHVRHPGLNCIDWEVSAGQGRVTTALLSSLLSLLSSLSVLSVFENIEMNLFRQW